MLEQLINRLQLVSGKPAKDAVDSLDIQRVSAMLLVEIARADHTITAAEKASVMHALKQASSVAEHELEAILDEVLQEAETAISLHEHISVINDRFNKADKLFLLEHMWRIALADGDIDRYEEYTIRKLCDLLFIKHRDYMQTKLRVLGDA